MAAMTQAAVRETADKWAEIQAKIQRAERAKNDALAPYVERHNEELRPILETHDKKINSLRVQADELEEMVLGWLNRVGKPISLEGEKAVAEVHLKESSRQIDAKAFFDLVKAKGAEFWGCVSIGIAKAERFLGKTEVDKISTKDTKLVAALKLK